MISRLATIQPMANVYDSTIGDGTKIANMVEIGGSVLGRNCKVQVFTSIPPGCVIGDRVFIGPGVRLCNDKYPKATGEWECTGVIIGDDSNIGANVVIMPGVKIGKNCEIAAGVLINRDIPDSSFVANKRQIFIKPVSFLNRMRKWKKK